MNEIAVSIVTPVFNEEAIVERSVRDNLAVMRRRNTPFELIIINDGSTDDSREIIERCFAGEAGVTIEHLPQNKGFGGAVRRGIERARGEYILCVPADSPLTEDVYSAFENFLGKADILVSYRKKRLGYNWWMLMNSTVYRWILILLFGLKLKDFNWIHMYRRKIFEDGITLHYDGIFMLAEVLVKAHRKGYSFAEFPVDQTQRITGIASVSKLSNILRTLKDTLKFYFTGK